MPIPVICQCGQRFTAKDDLAGKRAKCPTCASILTIPAAGAASTPEATPADGRTADVGSAIKVTCECGKSLAAPAKLAGKKVQCPACGQPLAIPGKAVTASSSLQTKASATIPARCQCGKSFAVKRELQGRKVKCPGCGSPITIGAQPVSQTDRGSAGEPSPITSTAGTSVSNVAEAKGGLQELLDEIGFEASATGQRCPKCKADMEPESILCIQCGYNVETGKQVETVNYSELAEQKRGISGLAGAAKQVTKSGGKKFSEGDIPDKVKSLAGILKFLGYLTIVLVAGVGIFGLFQLMKVQPAAAGGAAGTVQSAIIIAFLIYMAIGMAFGGLYIWMANLIRAGNSIALIVTFILAILGLPGFPIGTIISIYMLVLCSSNEVRGWCR